MVEDSHQDLHHGVSDGVHSAQDYCKMNISVLFVFTIVCSLVVGVYLLDRRWRRLQQKLQSVTGIMNSAHAFSLNLVRHFMPSFKVAKYQFRGMKPKKATVSVEFKDLGLELKNGKSVLNGVTGKFDSGRMCAIMGPSGAGKTTFMNTLCGKATYGKKVGSMLINGHECDPQELRAFMGFVPQDDIVHQDLTVREQIQFSVRLRNNTSFSKSRIERITEDVLNVMQIDHIQNSIVGSVEKRGISGGQRKRVNIGLELAAEPSLLFLDEPTSGLDATSSLAVCLSLKKMCQLGMTSIMVIHQPRYSLFTLFDDVLLLGKGGETVYLGPSIGAKGYFERLGFEMPHNENPSDWFMDVISGEVTNSKVENFTPDMLFKMWKNRVDDLEAKQTTGSAEFMENGARCREVTADEDKAVLYQKLQEEWDSVDINGDGVMDATELRQLLSHCASLEPSPEVVQELMLRMAVGAKEVTRRQFLDFLCNLSGDVATDRVLQELDMAGHGPNIRYLPAKTILCLEEEEESQASMMPSPSASFDSSLPIAHVGNGFRSLAARRAGFWKQLRILTLRRLVQWWRMNQQRAIFLAALAMGGAVLAVLDGVIVQAPRWDAMTYLNLHTCLALLLSIFCLSVFGNDQTVFWRESASGINVRAYFCSKVFVNTTDVIVQTFLFTSVYFLIRQPLLPFWEFIIPFFFTSYVCSGWGYLISTLVPPQHGPFIVSLVSFISCGLLGNPTSMHTFMKIPAMDFAVSALSITRWSGQMSFIIANSYLKPELTNRPIEEVAMLKMFRNVFLPDESHVDTPFRDPQFVRCAFALLAMGFVLRILAFLGLTYTNRSKQV